jgi:hypothetical protein
VKVEIGDVVRHRKYGLRYLVSNIEGDEIELCLIDEDLEKAKNIASCKEIKVENEVKWNEKLFSCRICVNPCIVIYEYGELNDGEWELCEELKGEYVNCHCCGIAFRKFQMLMDDKGRILCPECFSELKGKCLF